MYSEIMSNLLTIPDWIRGKVHCNEDLIPVEQITSKLGLNTVCLSAACPNRGECWDKKHVTFMILGSKCTRNCLFCDVDNGSVDEIDVHEPQKIADAVKELALRYVVITSVTRDDLSDKGSAQFVKTANKIKQTSPDTIVELLIPDMGACEELIEEVAYSGADVIGHNIEMPARLYSEIRPESDYDRSLNVLSMLGKHKDRIFTKSSMMLGIGETSKEIANTMEDLLLAQVEILYLGQYLRPTKKNVSVKKYYTPSEFDFYEQKAREIGFKAVRSGPLVRSSYRAKESFEEIRTTGISPVRRAESGDNKGGESLR